MSNAIPFIKLPRINTDDTNFISDLKFIYDNTEFIGGRFVEEAEGRLADIANVKNVLCCANGTDALQILLRAINIGPKDSVIVPDLTFWATYESVVNVGATPIICDIDFATLGLDLELVEQAIKEQKISAVINVNLYGIASKNQAQLYDLCKSNGVKLICDNAQAFGVRVNGESVFKNCHGATTSFYPAKVLGCSSDGGAIFTDSDEINERCRSIANHGRKDHYTFQHVGFNSRMSNISALYLNKQINEFSDSVIRRLYAIDKYRTSLTNKILSHFQVDTSVSGNGYLSIFFLDMQKRVKLEGLLKESRIGYGRVYPETVSMQPPAKLAKSYLSGVAKRVTEEIINLPVFPGITDDEIDQIIKCVNGFKG